MTVDLAPSILKTGLPLIEVVLDWAKHLFLLDSGASTNLVASSLKDSLPHEAEFTVTDDSTFSVFMEESGIAVEGTFAEITTMLESGRTPGTSTHSSDGSRESRSKR